MDKKKEGFYVYIRAVLASGVVVSSVLMIVGLVLVAIDPQITQVEALTPWEIAHLIMASDPVAILSLGLIVLLATPFLRVFIAMASFAFNKEALFTIISATLLLVLMLSVAIATGIFA